MATETVYEPAFDGFVLGDDDLGAGASRELERRTDAPLSLRVTLGDDGEDEQRAVAAPPVRERASVRVCPASSLRLRNGPRAQASLSSLSLMTLRRATSHGDSQLQM